jgi:hypothetical protein
VSDDGRSGSRPGRRPGPRIRTFKPELFTDEIVGRLPDRTFKLFMGLISFADDEGRFRAMPPAVIGHVFPYLEGMTPAKLRPHMNALYEAEIVLLFERNATAYGCFRNWKRHQTVSRPTPSTLPAPPDALVAWRNSLDYDGENDAIPDSLLHESSLSIPVKLHPPRACAQVPVPVPVPDPPSSKERNALAHARTHAHAREADVLAVWDHYVRVFAKNGNTRLDTHRPAIVAGLKVATVEECCRAIDGLALSQHHVDNGYTGLAYALRGRRGRSDREQIEWHIERAERAPQQPGRGDLSYLDAGAQVETHVA